VEAVRHYLDECPRCGAFFLPGGGEHLPVILLLSNTLGAGGNYPRPTAMAVLLLLSNWAMAAL